VAIQGEKIGGVRPVRQGTIKRSDVRATCRPLEADEEAAFCIRAGVPWKKQLQAHHYHVRSGMAPAGSGIIRYAARVTGSGCAPSWQVAALIAGSGWTCAARPSAAAVTRSGCDASLAAADPFTLEQLGHIGATAGNAGGRSRRRSAGSSILAGELGGQTASPR